MNKTILVTGAGRGLGYHIASKHAEMGDKVYAFDVRITTELEQLAEAHRKLSAAYCDIGSDANVQNAVKDVLAAGKQVDVLYNVAAIYRFEDRTGLAGTDLDACAEMYNINAVGALRMCKAVWYLLKEGSLVVVVSSEAGSITTCRRKQEYAYCMSKAALNMGTKILSNELWDRRVRVIAIHPGWMRTAMGGPDSFKSKSSVAPEESAENIVNIALNIGNIPGDRLFIQHTGEIMPW